jgi:hypothetical protein
MFKKKMWGQELSDAMATEADAAGVVYVAQVSSCVHVDMLGAKWQLQD